MITKTWLSWCWHLGLAGSLAVVGVVGVVGDRAFAQTTPDNTLGAENSVVTPNVVIRDVPSDQIDGGAIRGANLFHSFQQFNVGEGRGAYFTNPTGIENILSRVTGGSRSNIFGRLGVLGNANLFLINPNGTIFGPNSSLDVKGSFVTTSADAIGFGNQGFFSASDPTAPPLLTVNPSAFLFNQIAAGSLTNQSVAGLQVPDDRSLLLLGGDVKLEGGQLQAPGGFVEWSIGSQAGDIELDITGAMTVAGSDVFNTVDPEATGNAGDITINAGSLSLSNGAALTASTFGQGNAGSVFVQAKDSVSLANTDIFSTVESEAKGNGSSINVTARSLSLTNGAALTASTFGQGNAGSVTIQASGPVSFDGVGSDGSASGAFSTVRSEAKGNGGNINVMAGSLFLTNGAALNASTSGIGDAGNVFVQATDLFSLVNDDIDSRVSAGAQGNGGLINISAGLSTQKVKNQDGLWRSLVELQPSA